MSIAQFRIFMTGAQGQVARALREAVSAYPHFVLGWAGRPDIDLAEPATVGAAIDRFSPHLVINPAAYTAVDRAESEPDLAFAINRDGAGAVAAAAARAGAPILHLSTDYVYDGAKSSPYVERDPTGPQGVYGASKLAGEQAVLSENPQAIILRTAWVYSPFGANFVRTMLRLSAERDGLRVVDDQVGCPTSALDIADALLVLAERIARAGWSDGDAGVTHLAGPDAVSWCGFARAIIAGGAARGGRRVPVEPITTADFPTPAKRPANSQLSTARLSDLFQIQPPSLETSLATCLDRLFADAPKPMETLK
jgi:dTDP-4-dehydrorhamnose reductase